MMLFRESEVMNLVAYLKEGATGDVGDVDKAKIDKILQDIKEMRMAELKHKEQKRKREREKKNGRGRKGKARFCCHKICSFNYLVFR